MKSDEFDSFAVFRYPDSGQTRIIIGKYQQGLHSGFVIAPFIDPAKHIVTIANYSDTSWQSVYNNFKLFQSTTNHTDSKLNLIKGTSYSTNKKDHQIAVETIVRELSDNEEKKTITCRIISGHNEIDLQKSFLNLTEKLPDAFVFLFYTPESGCWLGASPEILLTSKNNKLTTYALAGTRKRGTTQPWDSKNIKEHKIVFDYIINQFKNTGLTPQFTPLSTRIAGNIEHLFQEIYSNFDEQNVKYFSLLEFLNRFSPTPALCGMPKEESIERIKRVEKFDREYYGGFCGWYESTGNFKFYVMLRCMKILNNCWNYFSGGGITCHSDAETEWLETELKSRSILDNLIFKP